MKELITYWIGQVDSICFSEVLYFSNYHPLHFPISREMVMVTFFVNNEYQRLNHWQINLTLKRLRIGDFVLTMGARSMAHLRVGFESVLIAIVTWYSRIYPLHYLIIKLDWIWVFLLRVSIPLTVFPETSFLRYRTEEGIWTVIDGRWFQAFFYPSSLSSSFFLSDGKR